MAFYDCVRTLDHYMYARLLFKNCKSYSTALYCTALHYTILYCTTAVCLDLFYNTGPANILQHLIAITVDFSQHTLIS